MKDCDRSLFENYTIAKIIGVKMQNEIMGIVLKKIASDEAPYSSIVKMTAQKLMKSSYMSLGDFFKSLTNNDLTVLNLMVDMFETDERCQEDLIVLTEMLAMAEGEDISADAKQLVSNVAYFCDLVAITSLYRKGLVDVIFQNMSFGSDMSDKPVVRVKM
jgi:hypothetical protein